VFVIAGDGSLQMNIQELSTAVANRLPVKIALLDNGYLGMVRQWQELFFNRRYSCTYLRDSNPDFVRLAEAYGAVGLRVEARGQAGSGAGNGGDRPAGVDRLRDRPRGERLPDGAGGRGH